MSLLRIKAQTTPVKDLGVHWTENQELINLLRSGGVAVMPSDTIYGISTSALDQAAVGRVFDIKMRDDSTNKTVITLCSSTDQIKQFGIAESLIEVAAAYWPGPVSIVFPSSDERFEYLRRGKPGISFRIPGDEHMRQLIEQTGPIISTSANLIGQPPAPNIATAKDYFGETVDMYVDGGDVTNPEPSSVIAIHEDGSYDVLRRGRGLQSE